MPSPIIKKLLVFSYFCVFSLLAQDTLSDLESQVLYSDSGSETLPVDSSYNRKKRVLDKSISLTPNKKVIKRLNRAYEGPEEIPPEQILVVQRRFIRKSGASELTAGFMGIQPADVFRKQVLWGFSYSYHFTEKFGVELLHATLINNFDTGEEARVEDHAGVKIDRNEPTWSIGSALLWTPLSAKTATADNIYYFEGYFALGGGVTRYGRGIETMGMGAIGFRSYLTRRSILKIEYRNYLDFAEDELEQRPNILIGWSILFGGDA